MKRNSPADLEPSGIAGDVWLLGLYEEESINRKAAFFRKPSDISLAGNASWLKQFINLLSKNS